MRSWDAMLADKAAVDKLHPIHPEDESWWFDFGQWLHYYFWPTRGWTARLDTWWCYNVRRYPKPPPLDDCQWVLTYPDHPESRRIHCAVKNCQTSIENPEVLFLERLGEARPLDELGREGEK